jgi:hypothetical protein
MFGKRAVLVGLTTSALVAGAAVGVAVGGGNAQATPATAFAGVTLATGRFAKIFSHVNTQDPQHWNEVMKTVGATDLFVQDNTWSPCGPGCIPSTGWHTHPGPSFVIVTKGTVTVYDGDDPTCTPHVYKAGTPNNTFIDPGGGHVHIIRDEAVDATTGEALEAKTIAVQFIPAGAPRRIDTTQAPGNCPF